VADRTSGDHPGSSKNGVIKAAQDVQTLADREQTIADADQTGSDRDQTSAENDQAASESDQAASDRDLEQGGDPTAHDVTRDLRDRGTRQREETAQMRLETAAARDVVARDRDLAASARDEAAALQDRDLASRAAEWGDQPGMTWERESQDRRDRDAAIRVAAAESRGRAAIDRGQSAADREESARDRERARADREALLHQLAIAETDVLTGARTRGPGLRDLDQEIDRARRSSGVLAVAYVDVVGLKAINDAQGHDSGDALLQRAVKMIRGHLRSYDSIVRVGGDEFLCVLAGATLADAKQRFQDVNTALALSLDQCEIKVGFAMLEATDTAAVLMHRADAELPVGGRR
jgi:diguanylate cyclase (GGDEF)-like protein